jgi:hypothetical protein
VPQLVTRAPPQQLLLRESPKDSVNISSEIAIYDKDIIGWRTFDQLCHNRIDNAGLCLQVPSLELAAMQFTPELTRLLGTMMEAGGGAHGVQDVRQLSGLMAEHMWREMDASHSYNDVLQQDLGLGDNTTRTNTLSHTLPEPARNIVGKPIPLTNPIQIPHGGSRLPPKRTNCDTFTNPKPSLFSPLT